jgi:phospholipid/cholesterol/gamma-HCH transport system substrate-binding protein
VTPRKLVTGLLVAVALVAVYLFMSRPDDSYVVKAEMQNAGGVKPNSSVKIAGVPGGKVKDLEITPRDTVIVTMKLDDDAAPIGRGASVEVRPTDLLGERYVALKTGDQSDPEKSGYTIPKSRSALPVELDDVLNTFDGDTRERIKILVNEFGVALGNRGKDLAELLDTMPPSLSDARQLVGEITSESASLQSLLERGDRLTATIDPKKDQLASLVTQADTTLRELAQRREKIGRTLDAAPSGLAALNRTLNGLRKASTDLRPASVDIQRAAAPLQDTLDALPGFEDAARDSLKAAKKAAPSVTKLGDKATGPLQALTPTLANLTRFSSELKPSLDVFDDRAFEDAMWFAQNLGGRGLASRDGLGHQLGADAYVNPQTVRAVLDSLFNGGAPPDGLVDGGPKAKARAASAPKDAKGGGTTTEAQPAASAPAATAPPAPASTGDGGPTAAPDKGLLGNLADGVSGLLGGDAGPNSKPGGTPQGGLPGLLDNLLAP